MEKDLLPECRVHKRMDNYLDVIVIFQMDDCAMFNNGFIPSRNDMEIALKTCEHYLKYSDEAIKAHNNAMNIIHHKKYE